MFENAGGDKKRALEYLASDKDVSMVKGLMDEARKKGIRGVPHIEINGIALEGAASPEEIASIINKV